MTNISHAESQIMLALFSFFLFTSLLRYPGYLILLFPQEFDSTVLMYFSSNSPSSVMDTHSNSQSSMRGLLHASPPREDRNILRQSSGGNGTYVPTNNHPDITYNSWTFNAHSPPLSLERKLQDLGELRLPPNTGMDNSSSMARFMTDDTSSRPLVELEVSSLSGMNNGYLGHGPHSSIATSWNRYQPSYHESADASSAVSSIYEYNPYSAETATSAWTGSPDGHRFRDIDFLGNTSPTSPGYTHELSGRRGHPSMDGCLLPSSPGMHGTQQTWRKNSEYSTRSNSGNNSPGGTSEIVGAEIPLNSHRSYVSLKSIQLTPAEDEREEERDDDEVEEGCSLNRNSIPGFRFHGPEHDTSSWCDSQGQYYLQQAPMEIECRAPSSCPSSPKSPRGLALLDARRKRRDSGASQLSLKERAELMKPYKDTIIGSASKNPKGRGAGKKHKERQRCPEHPNKSFRHNSDFRYSLPVPILPIASLSTRADQLTIISSHSKHMQTQHTRPFLCTFYFANCAQTFGSKNEWKRHVFSQHLQLHYWRCDHDDCAERKAFFNRKDLFGQHLKRMHGPNISTAKNSPLMKNWLSQEIPQIQERCRKVRRSPPDWSKCGYCSKEFKGEGSWDQRMEHVGKHYEKNNYKNIDPKAWVMDEGLVEWAIGVGIVEKMECGNHKLICSGKDSIDGEEKRRSQMERARMPSDNGDGEEDAEGEYEFSDLTT